WHTLRIEDGNDLEAIDRAVETARQDPRPSMIGVRTIIGFGSPNKAGSEEAHGAPLGADEVRLTKENLGWEFTEPFHVPREAVEHMRRAVGRGRAAQEEWSKRWQRFAEELPAVAGELSDALDLHLPADW